MIPSTKLHILLITALFISCIPQFSYTKFITLENEKQYAALIESKQPFVLLFTTRQYEHDTMPPALINDRIAVCLTGTWDTNEKTKEVTSILITPAYVNQATKEVAQEQEFDNITIARVDVEIDKLQSLVSLYHIKQVPTFLYFNNGSKINIRPPRFRKTEYRGYSPGDLKESLRKNIRVYLMDHNIENNTSTSSYSFKDHINYLVDMIISFIKKIIQSIKNLFN